MFLDIIYRPVFIYKHRPVYITKLNVSDAGFYLSLQVKPTLLGPKFRASPYLPEDGDRIQSPKSCVL
jgi:hypothetical protein